MKRRKWSGRETTRYVCNVKLNRWPSWTQSRRKKSHLFPSCLGSNVYWTRADRVMKSYWGVLRISIFDSCMKKTSWLCCPLILDFMKCSVDAQRSNTITQHWLDRFGVPHCINFNCKIDKCPRTLNLRNLWRSRSIAKLTRFFGIFVGLPFGVQGTRMLLHFAPTQKMYSHLTYELKIRLCWPAGNS